MDPLKAGLIGAALGGGLGAYRSVKIAPKGRKLRHGILGGLMGGLFSGVAGGLLGAASNSPTRPHQHNSTLKKTYGGIEVLNIDQVPSHILEAIRRMGGIDSKLKHANVSLRAFFDELGKIGW